MKGYSLYMNGCTIKICKSLKKAKDAYEELVRNNPSECITLYERETFTEISSNY